MEYHFAQYYAYVLESSDNNPTFLYRSLFIKMVQLLLFFLHGTPADDRISSFVVQ